MSKARVVLRLEDITKAFPGVVALKGVSLDVVGGEVHALLGENGAGKSTLISIAAGSTTADTGSVEIDGVELKIASPSRAQALGIAVVYQHTSVLDDLTVAENLLYCVPPQRRSGPTDPDAWVTAQLAAVNAHFEARTRVVELTAAERQLVEIAKAIALQPKVLVLDEPTEALTITETEQLFGNIDTVTARGTAVVYISHRLPEVKRIADRITVLRDGEIRGTFSAETISEDEILGLIIGRPIDRAFPTKKAVSGDAEPLLAARDVSNSILRVRNFDVGVGEVVGLAGVEGNGQREFIRALAGLTPVTGKISLRGRTIPPGDPAGALNAGIVYLPGDRHAEGLFLSLSVRENLVALVLGALSHIGFISRRRESALVAEQTSTLAIKTPSAETNISSLSGGNQQKVLFARSLARKPAVLLADEPTRGVDAGARVELYRILRESATHGTAVIVLSSDGLELQGLCDRIVVFSRGHIVRALTGDEISEKNITAAAITANILRKDEVRHESARKQRIRRFFSGDNAPFLIIVVIIALLAIYTSLINPYFLTARTINNTLFLASTLTLVGMGQLIVLVTGGIDLSVGPLTGVTVVILSFFLDDNQTTFELILGFSIAFASGAAVGLINGVLTRYVRLTPVIATLTTFIALLGVGLMLRSPPSGYIGTDVVRIVSAHLGPFPIAFLVVLALILICEWVLRHTRFGMELRAIGSNEVAARRLGASVDRSVIAAYVLCSLFTALGGVLLSVQVGIGDPTVGQNYSLQSVSAVILGGASIFGGRGSFLGVLASAVLIQEIMAATGFLGLSAAWQYWLPSSLILIAAGIYSRARVSATSRN
jgi:ribose transport system ATP-binding protein